MTELGVKVNLDREILSRKEMEMKTAKACSCPDLAEVTY